MSQEPISSPDPYCTPAQFLHYYDRTVIGQLVRDDGSRAAPSELDTDAVLRELLAAASGEVEIAAFQGSRYTVADLQALSGNGAAFLRRLVAAVAVSLCFSRRMSPEFPFQEDVKWAMDWLDKLRGGAAIFPLDGAARAGLPVSRPMTSQEILDLDLLSDRADRLFGNRPLRRMRGI